MDDDAVFGHMIELRSAIPLEDGIGMIGACVLCGEPFTAFVDWLEVPVEYQQIREVFVPGVTT